MYGCPQHRPQPGWNEWWYLNAPRLFLAVFSYQHPTFSCRVWYPSHHEVWVQRVMIRFPSQTISSAVIWIMSKNIEMKQFSITIRVIFSLFGERRFSSLSVDGLICLRIIYTECLINAIANHISYLSVVYRLIKLKLTVCRPLAFLLEASYLQHREELTHTEN